MGRAGKHSGYQRPLEVFRTSSVCPFWSGLCILTAFIWNEHTRQRRSLATFAPRQIEADRNSLFKIGKLGPDYGVRTWIHCPESSSLTTMLCLLGNNASPGLVKAAHRESNGYSLRRRGRQPHEVMSIQNTSSVVVLNEVPGPKQSVGHTRNSRCFSSPTLRYSPGQRNELVYRTHCSLSFRSILEQRPLSITLHSLSARRDVRHSAVDPPPGPTADSLRFSFPNTDRGCSELMSAGRTGLKLGVLMPLSLNLLEAGAHDESSCFNLMLAHTRLVKQRETLTLSPSPGNCLCLPHRSLR